MSEKKKKKRRRKATATAAMVCVRTGELRIEREPKSKEVISGEGKTVKP